MKPLELLQKHYGHSSFRGRQADVIEHLLSGKHAMVIMPTGMGKSVCFQIPALTMDGLALVISPLIALMKDQVDALQAKGIDATFINSSLDRATREERYRGVRDGCYRLLYVTPERFRKPEFLECMAARKVNLLAVDEAHCISEWGHDFRPDYTRIAEFRELLGNPLTVALTATATPDVQKDIIKQLGLTENQVTIYHEGIDRPNLHLEVEPVWSDDEKLEHILAILKRRPGSGIVYFALIRTLDRFGELLNAEGVQHFRYHGKLDPVSRKQIQEAFMEGEGVLVLATNAFGMGIDNAHIRTVTHAEVPGSMEAYYQEIGRAGRDGEDSVCTLLYQQEDLLTQMEFLKWSNPGAEFYGRVHQILDHDHEKVHALGMPWLKETLLHKRARHDFRVETALAMLERHGVIKGSWDDESVNVEVLGELPEQLSDQAFLDEKLKRDQMKLLALVEYTKCEGDRKQYINEYFGVNGKP